MHVADGYGLNAIRRGTGPAIPHLDIVLAGMFQVNTINDNVADRGGSFRLTAQQDRGATTFDGPTEDANVRCAVDEQPAYRCGAAADTGLVPVKCGGVINLHRAFSRGPAARKQ